MKPKTQLRWADKVRLALAVPNGRLSKITRQFNAMKHLVKLNPKRYSLGLEGGRMYGMRIYFQDKNWCGLKTVENISHYPNLQQIIDLDLPLGELTTKKSLI